MAEVAYKTASDVIAILANENARIAGMTAAQAAVAYGYTKTVSGLYMKAIIETAAAQAATASSAVAASTAIATTTTTSGCTVALATTSTGTLQAVGVASAALPVASCMAAAASGYLIGNAIYENNSDFLDKLMFPIYDFITGQDVTSTLYEDVPTTTMLFDVDGNTFLDGRLVDNTKTFLDLKADEIQRLITVAGTRCRLPLNFIKCPIATFKIQDNVTVSVSNKSGKVYLVIGQEEVPTAGSPYLTLYLVSDKQFTGYIQTPTINRSVTSALYGGILYYGMVLPYFTNFTDYNNFYTQFPTSIAQSAYKQGALPFSEVAHAIFAGQSSSIALPAGISKYIPGTSPAPLTFPEEVPAWKPVIVPKTAPTETPEPKRTPDEDPDPKRITPYIPPFQPQPTKVPIKKPDVSTPPKPFVPPVPNLNPGTSPAPYPQPDPNLDPSTSVNPPVTTPTTPQVPVNPAPTPDTGTGGTPVTPILPPIFSGGATGLLHVYNPTPAQIDEFGAWLWTTFSGDLIETLSKIFNNPMDAVIGLHEIYCTPTTGNDTTIRAGYLDSGVASRLVSNRYVSISCGAIGVPEYWNNYLDYTPYTKAYCYLPFIGIVELNADDIIGHGVEITYKVDTYNGSCIALITTSRQGSAETVTYQFSGNCSVTVPITSGVMSAAQSALIGLATGALTATGVGAGAGAAVAASGLAKGAVAKNSVQHSGSFGSSYGAMGIKTPYLIIKRPKQVVVPGYNETYGYPAHKRVTISSCQGFLKAIEVEVISPTATEEEKKIIEKLLKEGIFVN